jgi:hypothetical protein
MHISYLCKLDHYPRIEAIDSPWSSLYPHAVRTSTQPAKSIKHIPAERLLALATSQTAHFSPDESQHIKECPTCMDGFTQHVREQLSEKDHGI